MTQLLATPTTMRSRRFSTDSSSFDEVITHETAEIEDVGARETAHSWQGEKRIARPRLTEKTSISSLEVDKDSVVVLWLGGWKCLIDAASINHLSAPLLKAVVSSEAGIPKERVQVALPDTAFVACEEDRPLPIKMGQHKPLTLLDPDAELLSSFEP